MKIDNPDKKKKIQTIIKVPEEHQLTPKQIVKCVKLALSLGSKSILQQKEAGAYIE